jgi:hypothetical protein
LLFATFDFGFRACGFATTFGFVALLWLEMAFALASSFTFGKVLLFD